MFIIVTKVKIIQYSISSHLRRRGLKRPANHCRYLQKRFLGQLFIYVKMPRSTSSQKSATWPQTQDTELEDLVPGRLTHSQWADILAYEQADEAVAEHMEWLLKKVMDGCFMADIRQQVFPYTANWVKNRLVQNVEQHFLCRDEEDVPEEILPEDCEPPPAEPDTWAQGCVPLLTPSTPLRPLSPKEEGVVHEEVELEELPKCRALPQPKVSPKFPSKKTSSKPVVVTDNKLRNTFPQPKTEKKHNQVPIHAKPSKFLPPLSQSQKQSLKTTNEKTEVEVKMSTVGKSVPSYLLNKHKVIQKLDPTSLPDNCIFPKYEIVDSIVKPKRQRENKPQQKHMEPEQTVKPPRCDVDIKPKHGAMISSGLIRLENMILSKGVTLSQSAELNPITAPPQTPSVNLKPIRTEPALMFSANQFASADPQVKPLSQT